MKRRGENKELLEKYEVHHAVIESKQLKERVTVLQATLDEIQTRLNYGQVWYDKVKFNDYSSYHCSGFRCRVVHAKMRLRHDSITSYDVQ